MAEMIPIDYLYLVGGGSIVIIGLLLMFYLGLKNNMKEGKVYADARSKNLPVLDVVDISTGHAKVYLGEKDEDGDPMFAIEGLPMKIDPSMSSGEANPSRYGEGLNIWHFASTKALPLSVDAMLAFKTMSAHRIDKASFKLIKDVEDNELFSLLRLSKKHLAVAAETFVKKYKLTGIALGDEDKNKDMEVEEFVEIIESMKSYFATLPVETGFYCMNKAFAVTPYAHSSQDIERIKYLIEQKVAADYENRIKLMQYAVMFVMIIGVIICLVAVLLVLGGGKSGGSGGG